MGFRTRLSKPPGCHEKRGRDSSSPVASLVLLHLELVPGAEVALVAGVVARARRLRPLKLGAPQLLERGLLALLPAGTKERREG